MCGRVRELLCSGLCTLFAGVTVAFGSLCIDSGEVHAQAAEGAAVRAAADDVTLRVTVAAGNPGSEPVPLTLRRLDRPDPARIIVAEPGKATEVEVAPGTYQLTTSRAVILNGKSYGWDLELPLTGGVTSVELTEANAFASQSEAEQPPPTAAGEPAPARKQPAVQNAPPAPPATAESGSAAPATSDAAQAPGEAQAETVTLRVSLSSSLRSPKAKKIPIKLRRLDAREPVRKLLLNPAGSLHITLAPGRYQLLVDDPVSLGGRWYAWDLEIPVGNGSSDVVLGEVNALSMDRPLPNRNDGRTKPRSEVAPLPSAPAPQIGHSQPAPRELTALIDRWIASVKARDLDALMSCYAPVMDTYFLQDGVRWQAVRRDKQQFFATYSDIRRLEIANLRFERNTRGLEATFRKMWDFSGSRSFSGEVVSRLTFRNVDGRWVIASERERLVWSRKSPPARGAALSAER
ncbi:MAG TPA: nuclear transport factor 2 family protein [Clostridia bacterium]|nr:nuclear transport factor 2 family protein [Clostridia bacterium]